MFPRNPFASWPASPLFPWAKRAFFGLRTASWGLADGERGFCGRHVGLGAGVEPIISFCALRAF